MRKDTASFIALNLHSARERGHRVVMAFMGPCSNRIQEKMDSDEEELYWDPKTFNMHFLITQ